jgi:hypothetical protein
MSPAIGIAPKLQPSAQAMGGSCRSIFYHFNEIGRKATL